MDDLDRQLISLLRKGVPLIRDPFRLWALELGIDRGEVLLRISRLIKAGTLGTLRCFLDPGKLKYRSSLIAMSVEDENVERAVKAISGHPGLAYIYKCDARFNLWFNIAVPADHSLEDHLLHLQGLAGADEWVRLQTVKVYKTKSRRGKPRSSVFKSGAESGKAELGRREIECLRAIQDDFPLTDRPFAHLAKNTSLSADAFLEAAVSLSEKGVIKRFAADSTQELSRSRAVCTIAWKVPAEKRDKAGEALSSFSEVLSCVAREPDERLPYSIYVSVVELPLRQSAALVNRMEARIGLWQRNRFRNLETFKKMRIKYFDKALDRWHKCANKAANNRQEPVEASVSNGRGERPFSRSTHE